MARSDFDRYLKLLHEVIIGLTLEMHNLAPKVDDENCDHLGSEIYDAAHSDVCEVVCFRCKKGLRVKEG
jgi:hypothetical protein